MPTRQARWLEEAESAPLSWDPVKGGKRAWICFEDDKVYDLGADISGIRFEKIATRMMSGHYYPPDAIVVTGRFESEHRDLRVGDRLLQIAPLFGKLGGPKLPSATEIYVAERSENHCKIGYVTTQFHFGRGIWSSELTRKDGKLTLQVIGIASPHHWLFWLGLPYARSFQKRAWRRAVETFRSF